MSSAGYLISRAAEHPDVLSLTVAIVGVRFFALTRPVVRYLERLVSHDLVLRSLGRARAEAYERLEPLAPARLEGYRDGDLLARMVSDVDALQNLRLRGVMPPLVALVAGAAAVAAEGALLPFAAVVLGAGLLAGSLGVPLLAVALARRAEKRAAAYGRLSAELVETLGGAEELVAYGAAGSALERIRRTDAILVGGTRRAALADGAADGLHLLVVGATVCGVLAVAVDAHAAGHLSRALIAAVTLLALASFEAVQPLAQAARELGETLSAGRRLLDLIDRTPAVVDPVQPAELPPGPATVAFEGVRARYSPGEPAALSGLTFQLEPGRKIALVGPSGAGKTTAVALLERFLDPESGRVTLGGRDLRELRQEDVRRNVAVAGQGSYLFSTTIRENVRIGRPEAGDAEIEDALRRACSWSWVATLPDGWDTLVGEQGRQLSGGQRARIAVARALLADAPVLVLDEPTAHLDRPTGELLMEEVLTAAGERSVLLITHRPEGLDRMDEIVALERRT
jgi:thiol reductant ABC exporter CydC subunit